MAERHHQPWRVNLGPEAAVLAVRAVPNVRALDVHAIARHRQRPGGEGGALPLHLDPTELVLLADVKVAERQQMGIRQVREDEEIPVPGMMIGLIVVSRELGRSDLTLERDRDVTAAHEAPLRIDDPGPGGGAWRGARDVAPRGRSVLVERNGRQQAVERRAVPGEGGVRRCWRRRRERIPVVSTGAGDECRGNENNYCSPSHTT